MNFYEEQMRIILEENNILTDMKFCGKMMIAKLDGEKNFKAEFVSTNISGKYNAIKTTVINKNTGVVDSNVFKFSDIIGMYNRGNGVEPIEPHMWEYNGTPEWYTPISNQQKLDIGNTVLEYGGMYQDTQYAIGMQFK